MCTHSSKRIQRSFISPTSSAPLPLLWPLKKPHLRTAQLNRRRTQVLKGAKEQKRMMKKRMQIEMKNMKLYLENRRFMEENEKLRKQAMLLHEENQALLAQLQDKLSQQKWMQKKAPITR